MTTAWMKRGAERQECLEGLKMLVMQAEEVFGAQELQTGLIEIMVADLATIALPSAGCTDTPSRQFYAESIVPSVATFARTKEEGEAMKATLLAWIFESFAQRHHRALQHQELLSPERVFASTSVTEDFPVY